MKNSFPQLKNNKMMNLFIVLSLLLASCGGGQSGSADGQTEKTVDNPSNASCFETNINNPCALLAPEFIAEATGADEGKIEVENSAEGREVSKYEKASCTFSWPSNRKATLIVKAAGREMETEVELKNSIVVGGIDLIDDESFAKTKTKSPEAYFQRVYVVKSKADKEATKDAISRAEESDAGIDKGSADALSGMVDNEAEKKSVSGIGDKAVSAVASIKNYSNYRTAMLWVLTGNAVFKVEVDISDDDEADLETAMEVARAVIEGCK